jgi:mannose-1-phosphate guanylyltransferase
MLKAQVSIDAESFIKAINELTEAVRLLEEKFHQLETANITVNIMERQSDIDVDYVIGRIIRELNDCMNGDD